MNRTTSTTAALSQRKQRGCLRSVAWVFTLAFFGGGLAAFYGMAFRPAWGMLQAQSWTSTACQIVSSELKRNDDTSQVDVVFKYTVNRQEYQSNRYCFVQIFTNTSNGWKQQVIASHPPGKQTTCFVNQKDPNEAVIERGWVPDMWWCLFPVPFLIVGIVALLVAVGVIPIPTPDAPKGPASWKPRTPVESIADSAADEASDTDSRDYESDGQVILKPTASPFQMLIGAILIACFWNGIVAIFVWQQIQQFNNGGFAALNSGVCLILTPFVLIGTGLVVFVLYAFLTMFNPRPALTVNSVSIPLGRKLKLNWMLNGSARSIRRFRISLKGVEKATYRRGTTTSTDESTFADITIFETTDTFDMEEGTRDVVVPETTMHSFNGTHNKLEWVLEVRGEIPFWPDVSVAFPITITPKIPGDRR